MSLANALLADFRRIYGEEKTLLDLEEWMKSKLQIIRQRAKRAPGSTSERDAILLAAGVREVHSMRFDVIARRCAMPRMSVFR